MAMWRWVRQAPPLVRVYLVSSALFGASYGMFDLLCNLHLLAMGYSAAQVGTLHFVGMSVTALAAIPGGLLADRYGPGRFVLGGSLLYGLAMMGMPWSAGFLWVACFIGLVNLGQTITQTTHFAAVAEEIPPVERTTLFSLYFAVYLLGLCLGTLAAGQLTHLLPAGALSPYQFALLAAGIVGTLSSLLRQNRPAPHHEVRGRGRQLYPSWSMLQVAVIASLVGLTAAPAFRLLNVMLKTHYGMGAGPISLLMGVATLLSPLGAVLAPYLSRRLGGSRAAVLVMMVTGAIYLCASFGSTAVLFLLPLLIHRALHYTQLPLLDAFAMAAVTSADRSTVISYRQLGLFLGMAIGAEIHGRLIALGHYQMVFTLSGLTAAAAGLSYYLFFGRPKQVNARVRA